MIQASTLDFVASSYKALIFNVLMKFGIKIFKKYFEKNKNFPQFYYEKIPSPQKGSKSHKFLILI